MVSSGDASKEQPQHLEVRSNHESRDVLPPVEPPNARFLIQLFVIPLVIVSIIVAVWMMFSWLAHLGSDPKTIVADLKRLNQASWQKAMTLADLLRNPEHDQIKDDEVVARDLADFLEQQIDGGSLDKNSVKMRMFLCRALGEFRTPVVADALCKAASTDRDAGKADAVEINVRLSAMESLSLLANNIGPDVLRSNKRVTEVLLAAAKEKEDDQDVAKRNANERLESTGAAADRLDFQTPRAELRAVAAYALGVIGGDEALDRLYVITQNDPYANARYNAANGLARHGDVRAIETLVEMLTPDNATAIKDEVGEQERKWKQVLVINTAIRASRHFVEKASSADLTSLATALEKVSQSETKGIASEEAAEVLIKIRSR